MSQTQVNLKLSYVIIFVWHYILRPTREDYSSTNANRFRTAVCTPRNARNWTSFRVIFSRWPGYVHRRIIITPSPMICTLYYIWYLIFFDLTTCFPALIYFSLRLATLSSLPAGDFCCTPSLPSVQLLVRFEMSYVTIVFIFILNFQTMIYIL